MGRSGGEVGVLCGDEGLGWWKGEPGERWWRLGGLGWVWGMRDLERGGRVDWDRVWRCDGWPRSILVVSMKYEFDYQFSMLGASWHITSKSDLKFEHSIREY